MASPQSIKRILLRGLGIVFGSAVLVYAGDDVYVRVKRDPVGTVQVNRYLSVPQKGGKFQFIFDGTESRPCVNGMFPHQGNAPCWYLERHRTERVDM
jgi:hypothetical protein